MQLTASTTRREIQERLARVRQHAQDIRDAAANGDRDATDRFTQLVGQEKALLSLLDWVRTWEAK